MKSHKQGHTPLIRNKKCMICLLFQRPQAVILHTIHLISNSRKIQDGVGAVSSEQRRSQWPPWPHSSWTPFKSSLCRLCGDLDQVKFLEWEFSSSWVQQKGKTTLTINNLLPCEIWNGNEVLCFEGKRELQVQFFFYKRQCVFAQHFAACDG